MAVESNFTSLLQNLKLHDPFLPAQPWEAISSESGLSHHHHQQQPPDSKFPLYDPSTISEANLVRLVINALQGVESSLQSIEALSEKFNTNPADRTIHQIPNLWHRSTSSKALSKILRSIGRSGLIVFIVRKFVEYSRNVGENSSLVNQAFVVALEKVVQGFVCGLDTLYDSVKLRHGNVGGGDPGVGCLTSVVNSEVTFMEVYLHTKELRTQIEVIGNICMLKNVDFAFEGLSIEELSNDLVKEFCKFPRGADLLSYLYAQLRDADPVHRALLKFLFVRSCEPYYGFIKSWMYEARINDPYNEFIVEYIDCSSSYSHGGAGFSDAAWLSSIRVRDGVSVPCFLENSCLPLLRAGQQLHVLIKLLELCNCVRAGDQAYEDILPCWKGSSRIPLSTMSPLTFSTTKLEELVLVRESMYKVMQEKLQILIAGLDKTYQPMSCNVMSSGVAPFSRNNCTEAANIPVSVSLEKSLLNPTDDREGSDLETDSYSYETSDGDPSESSFECSSWNSSEEQTEKPIMPNDSFIEAELRSLSGAVYFRSDYNGDTLPRPSQGEKLSAQDCRRTNVERFDLTSKCSNPPTKKKSSYTFENSNMVFSSFSRTEYDGYQSINCWPLGCLPKNPFLDDSGSKDKSQLHFIKVTMEVPQKTEVFVGEVPVLGELSISDESQPPQTRGDSLDSGIHASSDFNIVTSWKPKYDCNVFKTNPMLTKNAWCCITEKSKSSVDRGQSCYPCFDFSSLEDPCTVYVERLRECDSQSKLRSFSGFAVSSIKPVQKSFREEKYGQHNSHFDLTDSIPGSLSENQQAGKALASTSGGANWETSLSYHSRRFILSSEDQKERSGSTFDIPIDVIIDKCILQEILLQYQYISNFTIRLLEEGFDLQEHLLALYRYHFMEYADWADLFIMSLWHHKWSVAEASEKIPEIQGLLDLSVQRSSCEGDPYKERLYLYMKVTGSTPFSTPATGVHAFDFIALGYRVDWPVSIVLTPSALTIYADIFSFLIQVKLAVFSLTDVWCTVKDLVHWISQNLSSGLDKQEKTCVDNLMRMRLQVNHFVSTLQQYVQSQLSQVSWCRFLHSLKHQVKDMFDLESVHMAYLADSLHICFLSDETRPIAAIIENILQCALDFRSCFTRGYWEVTVDRRDSSKVLGRINISQVLTIKAVFEKNLKELYLCYLGSPKHGEFSVCRFWEYLNYNDYYSLRQDGSFT